jgi:hypothetical protein
MTLQWHWQQQSQNLQQTLGGASSSGYRESERVREDVLNLQEVILLRLMRALAFSLLLCVRIVFHRFGTNLRGVQPPLLRI